MNQQHRVVAPIAVFDPAEAQAVDLGEALGSRVSHLVPPYGTRCYVQRVSGARRLAGRVPNPLRRFPRASKAVLIAVWVGLAAFLITNAWVILGSGADSTDDVDEVPEAQTAIVLGALVNADGTMSSMLEDRVARAHELWEAGRSSGSSSAATTATGSTTSPTRCAWRC